MAVQRQVKGNIFKLNAQHLRINELNIGQLTKRIIYKTKRPNLPNDWMPNSNSNFHGTFNFK